MTARALFVATALVLALLEGCGYRPVNDVTAEAKLAVVLSSSQVPDAAVSDEVVVGVREELARRGALAPGDGYPRCEIEVLRADEASEGIGAFSGEPSARASRVGIVARGWLVRSKDGPRERDTGDVRAMETVAVAADATTATFRHSDALKAAGRRVGHRLGARIVGVPSSTDD